MTDPHAAAASFRVMMAGFSAEQAIAFFKGARSSVGEKWLMDVLSQLGHARDYLEEAPALSLYLERVEARIEFFEAALEQARIGTPPNGLAERIYDAQGDLWDAAPLLPPA